MFVIRHNAILHFLVVAGGTILTVEGFGFGWDTTVMIGSEMCKVLEVDLMTLKCRVPMVRGLSLISLSSEPYIPTYSVCNLALSTPTSSFPVLNI